MWDIFFIVKPSVVYGHVFEDLFLIKNHDIIIVGNGYLFLMFLLVITITRLDG